MPGRDDRSAEDVLIEVVASKETRKEQARRTGDRGIAHGLGTFGMVGWSVAVPTLLGLGSGIWIDGRYGGQYSWTLMLMILGLMTGMANAWYWVSRESREPDDE